MSNKLSNAQHNPQTNLRYTNDIILLATSEAELQALVDCLDQVSCKYSLLVKGDKTKVMASGGLSCRILIQNQQPWITDYRRWWEYVRIPYQVKQGAGDGGITAENMEKSLHTDFMKIPLMKALVCPVAMYGCESWTLWKNEDTRLDAFEMKGLRKICWFLGHQRKEFSTKLE